MCDDGDRLAMIPLPRVREMVAAAVTAEREACAKLADDHQCYGHGVLCQHHIAGAIRHRGEVSHP